MSLELTNFGLFTAILYIRTEQKSFFIYSQVAKIVIHIAKAFVKKTVLHSTCKERRTKRQLFEEQKLSQIETY
jgi:hypothetical protein